MLRAYRPLLEPLDLTYPQYLVMLSLWETDGVSVTDLCRRTRLDTGTVTPLLKRLAAKGFLTRERSQTDERMRVIRLTIEGQRLRSCAEHVPGALACLDVLTPAQGAQLKDIAETLYRNLSALE